MKRGIVGTYRSLLKLNFDAAGVTKSWRQFAWQVLSLDGTELEIPSYICILEKYSTRKKTNGKIKTKDQGNKDRGKKVTRRS